MGKVIFMVCVALWAFSCSIQHGEPVGPDCFFENMDQMSQWLIKTPYVSDLSQFKRTEYWQNPNEFWSNGRGDCEDKAVFAIWYARTQGMIYGLAVVDLNGTRHAMLERNGMVYGLDGHSTYPNMGILETYDWDAIKHKIRWD